MRVARAAGLALVSLIVLLSAVWVVGALHYQGPGSLAAFLALAGAWCGLALWALADLWRGRWRGPSVYAAGFAGLLVWWSTILPSNDRVWAPEMARMLTYERTGDIITVHNVRNFDWSSLTDADERWETRSYDLGRITGVDVGVLYWMGPMIGHTYLEFIFEGGEALSVSVEIRKEAGEEHSSIAGLFKTYELAVIAGDERDFIGWRVYDPSQSLVLVRTNATPDEAKAILLALLDEANALAVVPRFYNTITENCTTVIWSLTSALGAGLPFDYRVLLSGYLPDYLYDLGRLNTSLPLTELRRRGADTMPKAASALKAGLTGPAFSAALREGVPPGR